VNWGDFMPARNAGSRGERRRRELLRALMELDEEEQGERPKAVLGGLLSSEQLQGFIWGAGAAALLLMVLPTAKQTLRPFAVSAVKGGMDLMDQFKTMFGEAGEGLQDLIAEAQFDRMKDAAGPSTTE
jgi:hypothetical protein